VNLSLLDLSKALPVHADGQVF